VKTLQAGFAYFGIVFAAGLVLGPLRVLALEPRVGSRAAELMELPLMLVVIVYAARWIVRRFLRSASRRARLAAGAVALASTLAAELTLVVPVRGLTVAEYFATRDPVAGGAYYAMLAVFALMPLLVCRR